MNHKRDKHRATALPNSPTLQQLWDALGSKLIEETKGHLPHSQLAAGSSPSKDVLASILALSQLIDNKKGNCLTKNSPKCQQQQEASVLGYQGKEFEMMTLQDALLAYKTYAGSEGIRPKTIISATGSVGYFAHFLGPERQDIGSITGNDLRRFIIALQEKHKWSNHPYNKPQQAKLSPYSINTYARAIRAFFGFLYREGFIEANPMEKVKAPKVPEIIVPTLSLKEVEKLLAQPNKHSNQGFRDYAILLTFYDTTIRLSELAGGLKAGDIDYDQSLFIVMGKGNRQRYVPFGRRVARALMKYQLKHRPEPIGTDNFFLRHDGQPLPASRIQKLVSMYGKKAGLHCYAHKLRHTSSVMFLRNGGGEFALQRKLGHKSLVMTRRYSNLADTDVRDSHLKHSPGDRLRL